MISNYTYGSQQYRTVVLTDELYELIRYCIERRKMETEHLLECLDVDQFTPYKNYQRETTMLNFLLSDVFNER